MEEIHGVVQAAGRDASAGYRGHSHGLRGSVGSGGPAGQDSEVSPGRIKNGSNQGGYGRPGVGGHVKAGPAQEGPGKDRGLGREGEAEKRAGEVESHAGHESSVEGKRREGNHAVGSRMHVFLWVSEGRRGAGPGEGRVRREGPFGLGRRAEEDAASPRWIRLRIKKSKTDRLREGAFVTLPRTDLEICPVRAVLEFMVVRKAGPGPFFRDREKGGLTRRDFVSEVRKALAERGMPDAGISGHSFRIGAATAAAVSGASDEEVKALGRWRSKEYKGYIRREEGDQAASAKKWAETVKAEKE